VSDAVTSTKPYLIRAIHEWCADNGLTPYLAVTVDERTSVPREYVRAGEIVLNVSMTATDRLTLGNDEITFQARFGGVARLISVPIEQVSAIYARENGQGMAFEVPKPMAVAPEQGSDDPADTGRPEASSTGPSLAAVDTRPDESSASSGSAGSVEQAASTGGSQRGSGRRPSDPPEPPSTPPAGGRPRLTRIK